MIINLSPEVERDLEAIALAQNTTSREVAIRALTEYADHMEKLITEVHAGDASAEEDGWIPHEDVVAMFQEHFSKRRDRRVQSGFC